VSNLGINNWAAPAEVLAECFRVAKPGARIVLTTNTVGHYREFYDLFRETLTELNKTEAHLARLSRQEAHRGTRESLSDLIEKAGWNIFKVIEESFQMRFLDGSALFRHSLTRLGFLDGWRGVLSSEEETEVFSTLERKLNETARQNGELRLTVPMLYLEGRKTA
jgi:SAM-dependent methyltransferase